MPQWRKLQTRLTESDDLNAMPDDFTRLVWVLLPLGLDREGRALDNPSLVKARIMPLRDDVTSQRMGDALDAFAERGLIQRYQVGGRRYFWVPTFLDDQGNTSKEAESAYPAPEQGERRSGATPELLQSRSGVGREQVERSARAARAQVGSCSSTDSDADSEIDTDAEGDAESDSESEWTSDSDSEPSPDAVERQGQSQRHDTDPKSCPPTLRIDNLDTGGPNEEMYADEDGAAVRDAVVKASHEFRDTAGIESNLAQLRGIWEACGMDAVDMLAAVTETTKRTRFYASKQGRVRNQMGYWFRVLRDVVGLPKHAGPG